MKLNNVDFDTYFNNYPDKDGYFGKYGGVYVDDKLKAAMAEITEAYFSICQSRKFIAELRRSNVKPYQPINIVVLGDVTESLTQLVFSSMAAILQKEKGRFLSGHIHQGMGIIGM